MRDAAFALIWMVLLPMATMSALVGILLWVWVAVLSPNDFLYGPLAGVPFNKLVAVATLCILLFSKERKDLYLDVTGTLILALLLSATLSWIFGLISYEVTMDQYLKLVKELVLVGTILVFMKTRLRLYYVLMTLCVAIGFFAVTEAGMFLATAGGHKVLGIPSIGDNNSLATAILMCVPIMLYLARYSEQRFVKYGFQAGAVLSIVTVVATFSRGGFVGLVALALFLVKNSRRKLFPILAVMAGGLLIMVLAPDSWFERLNTINEAGQDGSFMGRVVVWKMSLLIAMDRPFLGAGPHGVQYLPVWNAYKPLLPLVNFVTTPPPALTPFAAHSVWFEMLGDFGVPGFLAFVGIMGMSVLNCRRIVRLGRLHPELGWAADLARMLQVTVVLYAVTGSALSLGYYEGYWIVVAVVARLTRNVKQDIAAKAAAAGQAGAVAAPVGRRPQPEWTPPPAGLPQPARTAREAAVLPNQAGRAQMRPIH